MTAIESFPGPSGLVDSIELRKNLSGLIVRDTTGAPRAGVFPRHASALVTATASTGPMTVNVAAFEAALVRQGGPLFMQNDGTVAVTIGTAPVANSRIDVVYAKQNESAAPMSDGSDSSVIAVAQGTAAASPSKPSIPVGALELATVTVPAGATATNGGGVVITQTCQFTATSGGVVLLRNQAQQDAWNPTDSASLAFRMDSGRFLRRLNSAWRPLTSWGEPRTGTTNVNGVVFVPNPLAPVAPTWIQVTMGPQANETLARITHAMVWSNETTQTQVRFRRSDTNEWLANNPVSFYITYGIEG